MGGHDTRHGTHSSHSAKKASVISEPHSNINYKGILDRISGIHKQFKELTTRFNDYNAKGRMTRDKSDEIAKSLMRFKKFEPSDTTAQYALELAANTVGKLGDHQTASVLRLEKHVLPNLSAYKKICKCLKHDVTSAMAAESQFRSKKKLVEAFDQKARSDPRFNKATSDAEKQYENAVAEFRRLNRSSQEQIVRFEHKRLMDLKEAMETFFKIEMAKCAKSLEILTEGYNYVHSIDEDADLQVIKRSLHLNLEESAHRQHEKSRKVKKAHSKVESTDDEESDTSRTTRDQEIKAKKNKAQQSNTRRKSERNSLEKEVSKGSSNRPHNYQHSSRAVVKNASSANLIGSRPRSTSPAYYSPQNSGSELYKSTDKRARKAIENVRTRRNDIKTITVQSSSSTPRKEKLVSRPSESLFETALKEANRPISSPARSNDRKVVQFNQAVSTLSKTGKRASRNLRDGDFH